MQKEINATDGTLSKGWPRIAGSPENLVMVPMQTNPFWTLGSKSFSCKPGSCLAEEGKATEMRVGLAGAGSAPRVGGWGAQKIEEELGYYISSLILYQSSSLLPPSPERRGKELKKINAFWFCNFPGCFVQSTGCLERWHSRSWKLALLPPPPPPLFSLPHLHSTFPSRRERISLEFHNLGVLLWKHSFGFAPSC